MTEQTVIPETKSRYVDAMDEITALVKGRVPIIWVLTHEEDRFIEEFREKVAKPYKKQLWMWSAYQGLIPCAKKQVGIRKAEGDETGTHVAKQALERIVNMDKTKEENGICFLMRDMHVVLGEENIRIMRDIYAHLIGHKKTIVIISPVLAHGQQGNKPGIPPTLEKQVSVINYELPKIDDIKSKITAAIGEMKDTPRNSDRDVKLDYSDDEMDSLAKALCGLTMTEVENAIATSITHLKGLNVKKFINEKKQIVTKSDILEFKDTDVYFDQVGGLDNFKQYIERYINAQSDEAKAFGVEPLRGLILTGVPGVGKSLSAKALGNLFKQPFLVLNIGKVMAGLVGQSESRMRDVIKTIKSMVPCVVLLDEVEKSLSGTKSSNHTDGGTTARVFGTLLYAMEEELEGCTIVATSNDISALPPEFIRRFNDVFFVDLPGPDERWDIFTIHLEKRGRDIKKFEKYKDKLLDASTNYTGAEIEKAIKDAIASAFYAGSKDVSYKNILQSLADTKPISKVMKKKIDTIREKARGNYRYASSYAEEQSRSRKITTENGKQLDINEALDDMPEMIQTSKEKKKKEIKDRTPRFADLDTEN